MVGELGSIDRSGVPMMHPSLLTGDVFDELAAAAARSAAAGVTLDFTGSIAERADRERRLRALRIGADSTRGPRPHVPALPASSRAHDAYFGVRRVSQAPADTFLVSLVAAHLMAPLESVALENGGWDDSVEQLFEGLRAVFGPVPLEPRRQPGAGVPEPMTIWLAGHRLFFALEQGAVLGLRGATARVAQQADPTPGLRFAAAFLRSSAAAMRLASSFDPQRYLDEVRPDMAPPKVDAGFSGLYTVDHKELVRAMVEWRSAGGGTRQGLSWAVAADELLAAVRTVYLSHEFVCERFRGGELPSLRSAARRHAVTPPTGVAVAKAYTRRRTGLLR